MFILILNWFFLGSSLLLVNSSDSSDCEDHESATMHHHHLELARLHQDRLTVGRPSSRNHSSERPHDPFSNNSVAGNDVVDELLKPLQSYFSVFRTGSYDHGSHHGLLDGDVMNGRDGPPAHNTRSHDKRYKIKKNQQSDVRKRQEGSENGIMHQNHAGMHHHPPPQQGQVMHPSQSMSAPPPLTNGGYAGTPVILESMETEIAQHPPPNMNEPPPNMVSNSNFQGNRPLILLPSMVGPPPGVMMSPPGNPQMYSTPQKEERRQDPRQEQLEADISNLSLMENKESSQVINSCRRQRVQPARFWRNCKTTFMADLKD